MAIVNDLARGAVAGADITVNCANEDYQSGNDSVGVAPTWDIGIVFASADTLETHIPLADEAETNGVANSTDDWTPHVVLTNFWLDSTPATERFT